MKGIRIAFFLALISVLCWQCSDRDEIQPVVEGSNYFPLKTGSFQVYQVDQVIYNSPIDSVVSSYLLKVSVVDSFTNLESGISYTIKREKSELEEESWIQDSIWTARKDTRRATVVEHNVPIVKLTFPLRDSVTWDANMLNSKDTEEYIMLDVEEPYRDEYGSYDKTVTVLEEYFPENIVNFKLRQEIFAENVGLVFKERTILFYDQASTDKKIRTGIKYFQYLVAYGEE